jgi:hypothetical protein
MRGFDYCKGRRLRRFSLAAAGLTVALAPLTAHADGMIDSGSVNSWMATVQASQDNQPHWMTPLVTVTPRLEQELRWDVYDQQNGKGSQGNSQHLLSDGGPGGPRIEVIPTYNTEIILAAPPVISATGPRGTQTSPGDWPAFLAKYRFISANEQNGNYIVTGFFQMSVPSGYGAGISNQIMSWLRSPPWLSARAGATSTFSRPSVSNTLMGADQLASDVSYWPLTTRRTLVANCRFRGATDIRC